MEISLIFHTLLQLHVFGKIFLENRTDIKRESVGHYSFYADNV